MPISLKQPTHLSAAHFQKINFGKNELSASKYKRFKSESHCKDVEEMIQLTEKLVQDEATKNELLIIKDGLQTLQEGYEVTVQKDHPFRSFVHRFFPNLFKKHDQKVKLSLNHMIVEIQNKIYLIEREAAGYSLLVGWIQDGEKEILSSSNVAHKNVQRLVRDSEFCKDAKTLIKDLANAEGKSSVDRMKYIIEKIEEMKTKYGGGEIDYRELINAAIFAGKKNVPHLVNQLVKIRDDNYEVVFPPQNNNEMKEYNKCFKILAKGIQYCSQNKLETKVDLLHDKIADGVKDGFVPWLTEIEKGQSEVDKLVNSILRIKKPSFLEMVEEMGLFSAFDPKKSPEENLLKLTSEFDRLKKRLGKSDLKMESPALTDSAIAKAFLVAQGELEMKGFVTQLNNLLQKVDPNKLLKHTDYVSCSIWVQKLLLNIKSMSGIDLQDVYSNSPEIKAPFEAKFSDYVSENMERARQKVNSKIFDPAYDELDKAESDRISEFLGSPAFRKEAKSFLKKVSRSSSKTPIQEKEKMRKELNRFYFRLEKKLPKDMKIQVGDLDALLRAAMLSDRDGRRVTSLLIKMKGLLQKEPSLASDPVIKDFQQFKVFRNALDFCCRIDPEKLVESQLPQLEKAGTDEMADFKNKIENKAFYGLKDDPAFVKAINELKDDPAFVNDAKNLFEDFLNHDKWGGVWSKSEQFGEQFHELIVKKHAEKFAKKVGLRPSEITRQEEETLLLATAVAAGELAPKVFSQFNAMKLEDFPINNPAQMISYDMYNIVKTISRGKEAFSSKEHPVLKKKIIKKNFQDVSELLKIKNSKSYAENDKENVQYMLALSENNEFKSEAMDFLRRIAISPFEDPVVEMQRMRSEFSIFVRRINTILPQEQRAAEENLKLVLQSALLADSETKHLFPVLVKIEKLIENAPQLTNADEKAPEHIRIAFNDFQMFRDAFDYSCRIDPVKLLMPKKEKIVHRRGQFEYDIGRNLDQMKVQYEKKKGEKERTGQIVTLFNDPDFQKDAKEIFRDLLDSNLLAGTHTMMELVGRQFHEKIIKEYAKKIGANPQNIGTDDLNDLTEAWLIAGKEHVPAFIRMFKGFNEDRMQKVDNNYKAMAFNINMVLNYVEQFKPK